MLTIVGSLTVAAYVTSSAIPSTRYVAVTSASPGKPWSPAGECSESVACSPSASASSHARIAQKSRPLWLQFAPSLAVSGYSTPPSENRAPPMRLTHLPTVAPMKFGLSR